MNAFRFPLQKALELRHLQLNLEEARFQQTAAALAVVDRRREQLLSARADAEKDVRCAVDVPGEDLMALGAFRVHSVAQGKRLLVERGQCQKAMEDQRSIMLEARRGLRLIERLRERRHAEWTVAVAKELEEVASESFLSRWSRESRAVK